MTNHGGVAGDILRSFIERIERLEIDKKAISEDMKEVFAEAKSSGFEPKIMRKVISLRKMEAHERQEQEALLDIYLHAVEGGTPAGPQSVAQGAEMGSEATDDD
jgi:uncharacterized protein (UPF0335 family)